MTTTIFGKDTDKVLRLCQYIYNNTMDRGMHTIHPALRTLQENGFCVHDLVCHGEDVLGYMHDYASEHPDEMRAYDEALIEWINSREKALSKLYGIARQHHCYIEWYGNDQVACTPNRFVIKRGGRYLDTIKF